MATRYWRDQQKLQIEGQTIQKPYLVGILWPLYFLTFDLQLLFISSVSCGHCIVWPSICSFCLSRRYLVAIVLSNLRFVASVYLVGIFWQGQTIQKTQDTDEINRSFTSEVKKYNDHKIPTRWTEATNRRSDNTMATKYRHLVAFVLSDIRFVASVDLVSILWPL
jgi:hypothetical protein